MKNKLLNTESSYVTIPCMDRELVLAHREGDRIGDFMLEMVRQEKLSPFHHQLVIEEGAEVLRQAGYIDSQDRHLADMGEEELAVTRHINDRKRQKLLELHPEFEEALKQAIAYRQVFPTPVMTPEFEKPGAALAAYRKLLAFIDLKRDRGELKRDDAYAAYEVVDRFFADEGIDQDQLTNKTDKIVIIKATKALEDKLLEVRPDLADELRNLRSGRSK